MSVTKLGASIFSMRLLKRVGWAATRLATSGLEMRKLRRASAVEK